MAPPKNFLSIQFLRFIAALLVVLSHANYIALVYWPHSNSPILNRLFDFGHSGVHIFFVISGFVMVASTFGQPSAISPQEFLFRRFLRIYPIYWVYAMAYVAWKLQANPLPLNDVIMSLLLLPGHSAFLIPQGWTLSFEIYFYLCFACIIPFGMNRGVVALTAFFISAIALRKILPITNPFTDLISNSLLLEFLAGSILATAVTNRVRLPLFVSNALILSATVLFALGLCVGYEKLPSVLIWGIPSGMLVSGMVFRELNDGAHDAVYRLAFLGDSSYSLYLLHAIVLAGLFFVGSFVFAGSLIERISLNFAFSAVCVLMSLIFYELLEKQISRRRFIRKMQHAG
jgi:exopolysaccharide production protein ExoZ